MEKGVMLIRVFYTRDSPLLALDWVNTLKIIFINLNVHTSHYIMLMCTLRTTWEWNKFILKSDRFHDKPFLLCAFHFTFFRFLLFLLVSLFFPWGDFTFFFVWWWINKKIWKSYFHLTATIWLLLLFWPKGSCALTQTRYLTLKVAFRPQVADW